MLIAQVNWSHNPDRTIDLTLTNCLTGASETRRYKTHRSAKCAETKFFNRMHRIYDREVRA